MARRPVDELSSHRPRCWSSPLVGSARRSGGDDLEGDTSKQTNKQTNKQTPSSALCSADQPMFAQAFPFRACLLVCGRQHKGRGGCCVTDGFVRAACSKATRPSSGCARCSTRSTWTEAARSTRMRCAMDSSGWASRSRQAAMPPAPLLPYAACGVRCTFLGQPRATPCNVSHRHLEQKSC